jgi:hypothetical protein
MLVGWHSSVGVGWMAVVMPGSLLHAKTSSKLRVLVPANGTLPRKLLGMAGDSCMLGSFAEHVV